MPIPPSRNRFLKKFFVLQILGIFWRQILRDKFVHGILREEVWLTRFFASVFAGKNFARRIPANKKILAGRRTKFLPNILGEEIWRDKFVQVEILGQKCIQDSLPKFFGSEFGGQGRLKKFCGDEFRARDSSARFCSEGFGGQDRIPNFGEDEFLVQDSSPRNKTCENGAPSKFASQTLSYACARRNKLLSRAKLQF